MGIAYLELIGLLRHQSHRMKSWKVRFGIRMRTVRQFRNKLQKEVCADVGIDQGTLSRIEDGKSDPSFYLMYRFARLYQWPVHGFDPDVPLGDFNDLLPPPPTKKPPELPN